MEVVSGLPLTPVVEVVVVLVVVVTTTVVVEVAWEVLALAEEQSCFAPLSATLTLTSLWRFPLYTWRGGHREVRVISEVA